jgi:hypothetical protein
MNFKHCLNACLSEGRTQFNPILPIFIHLRNSRGNSQNYFEGFDFKFRKSRKSNTYDDVQDDNYYITPTPVT